MTIVTSYSYTISTFTNSQTVLPKKQLKRNLTKFLLKSLGVLDPDYGRCPKDDEIGTFLHSYFYYFNMHDNKDGESTANQIDAEFMGDKNDYIRQIHIFEAVGWISLPFYRG